MRRSMKKIISKNHNILTQNSNKRSLSCFYDKKYVLTNRINTFPFGDDDILKIEKIYIYIYITMTSVNIINHASHFTPIKNIKTEEQLLKEFKDTLNKITKPRNKWVKEFEDICAYVLEQPYKLEDALLLRHFLLISVEEINFLLFKNNKPYRVNFKDEA